MKQILRFVRALLQRHWVSFLLACVVPSVVGLIAVAATTVITDLHYADFLYDDYYNDVITIYERKAIEPIEGFSYRGMGTYEYFSDTETENRVNECMVIGRKGSIGLEFKNKSLVEYASVIDYDYWQNFPSKIYSGNGFTGTCNEILLDISNIHNYEIGFEYEFNIRNRYEEGSQCSVKATVVGFTRTSDYLRFSDTSGILCMPYEEAKSIGAYKSEFRYIKIPSDLLKKLVYRYLPDGVPNEEYEERLKEDLRNGNFYVPEEHIEKRNLCGSYHWTIGSSKRASTLAAEDANKFTIALFLAISLSMLAILSDLCLNGSMLKRTERVAIRSGLRYKDVSIGYVIKAVLQFLISSVIILGVILYYNHKTAALLIMEHMWAGIVAVLALGLISWSIDSVRLYMSQRKKD